jgi:hypothetical protein
MKHSEIRDIYDPMKSIAFEKLSPSYDLERPRPAAPIIKAMPMHKKGGKAHLVGTITDSQQAPPEPEVSTFA